MGHAGARWGVCLDDVGWVMVGWVLVGWGGSW